MSLIKSILHDLLLILLLAAIVVTAIFSKYAWLPLFDHNATGNEIDRLPPDDRMAHEAASYQLMQTVRCVARS